jgi:hypothetical protein
MCRDFIKTALELGSSVDNSRRGVCNRGRDPSIGFDGASRHAHRPPTHRQRLRRPLRSIRRCHHDGPAPGEIATVALPRGRASRRGRRWHRGPGPHRRTPTATRPPSRRGPSPPGATRTRRRDHPRDAGRVRRRRPGRRRQPRCRPPALAGRGRIDAGAQRGDARAGDPRGRSERRGPARCPRRGGPAPGRTSRRR